MYLREKWRAPSGFNEVCENAAYRSSSRVDVETTRNLERKYETAYVARYCSLCDLGESMLAVILLSAQVRYTAHSNRLNINIVSI